VLRSAPGKRAAQKQATKEGLQHAALRRFREQGFDQTSVAQVAADAGVTERTFFRYFPSKEAVLFQDYESRLEWFGAALAVRPTDEPFLDSVMVAVGTWPDDREILHQVAALRDTVLSTETIEGHLRLVQGAFARELEANIRVRLSAREPAEPPERVDLLSIVLGNAIAGALLGALELWTRAGGGAAEDLEPITRDALDALGWLATSGF
jgi:AcrR family transcriptional regulator